MPRDLPSLNAVRVFEAAARHQNFSRAAEELNVTQSAVSRQVQHLEDQLGQRLFVRKGPRLTLTASGRAYLDVVQEGLSVIRRGTRRLFRPAAHPVLTLSAVPSLISRWIVPRIAEFERDQPDISLRLSASYQLVDFAVSTDIDAAIRYGRGHWAGVEAQLILDDVIFPVCNPEVAERLKQPSDLLAERLFVEDPNWDFWEYWARAAGLDPGAESAYRFSDDFNVQIQAAALGHGITLARGLLVADEIRAGRLVCPFKLAVRAPVQYYYVYPTERRADKLIESVAAWLTRTAQATVAGMAEHWGEPIVPSDPLLRAL